ncbi:UNVERIFIED_CONTAM: hypothetical protein FKN15_046607 [Acipenser sinensis]
MASRCHTGVRSKRDMETSEDLKKKAREQWRQKMLRELAFAGEYRKLGQIVQEFLWDRKEKVCSAHPGVGCGERDELVP